MTSRTRNPHAHGFVSSFWNYLFDSPQTEHALFRRDGVYWIGRVNGWYRPFGVRLHEYAPRCVRITTHLDGLAKSRWPFSRPAEGGVIRFELTFHESELTPAIHELIRCACMNPDYYFKSPLFAEQGETPGYAWTKKAKACYDADRAAAGERL